MNKRALELSINFLVMAILGIAMLSMGIVFFRKMFTGATELKASLDAQTEQELENLLTAGERIAIPFTKKEIRAGKTAVFGLGILNVLGYDDDFTVYIKCSTTVPAGLTCTDSDPNIIYRQSLSIENNKQYKMPVAIKAPSSVGTYIIDINVCNGSLSPLLSPDFTQASDCDSKDEYYDDSLHKIYLEVS